MVSADLLEQLKRMSIRERLRVIEKAARLIRADLQASDDTASARNDERMRTAAERVKDLYEPGSEHVEWTCLDGEDVLDDTVTE